MKNTFGNSVAITLFGESHGEMIGAVLDGLCPGLCIEHDYISHMLTLRRGEKELSTARREADLYRIVSGVQNGKTTGTPLTILIENADTRSADYEKMQTLLRPSHADFAAECKYHGYQDARGGGHFSGRITAALVAAGAICKYALEACGIAIGTHVKKCAGISDCDFSDIEEEIARLNQLPFAVLDDAAAEKMRAAILAAAKDGDSVGGVLETAVVGLPAGVGEPWFDTLEGVLSHALFSIPAIKGVEFGAGFALADMRGSAANDAFCIKDASIATKTNRNGGINGGITNGMPLLFSTAVKPTPTIYLPQQTVDYKKMTEETLAAKGRHDPAIVHRARTVQDAVTALVLCDMLSLRYGTDFLKKNEA